MAYGGSWRYGKGKINHSGIKRGCNSYCGKRFDAKLESNSLRRIQDREFVLEEILEYFDSFSAAPSQI